LKSCAASRGCHARESGRDEQAAHDDEAKRHSDLSVEGAKAPKKRPAAVQSKSSVLPEIETALWKN